MKLPIYLHIESDTIWTTYRSERDKLQNADELKVFVKRWQNLLNNVKEETLTENVLAKVKTESIYWSEDKVREAAYLKWEKALCPQDNGVDFWLQAEEEVNAHANLIAELVVPALVVKAMIVAKTHVVPLNCAFIQMNGGLGEFEWW